MIFSLENVFISLEAERILETSHRLNRIYNNKDNTKLACEAFYNAPGVEVLMSGRCSPFTYTEHIKEEKVFFIRFIGDVTGEFSRKDHHEQDSRTSKSILILPFMQKPVTVLKFGDSLSIWDLLKALEISKEKHPTIEMEFIFLIGSLHKFCWKFMNNHFAKPLL